MTIRTGMWPFSLLVVSRGLSLRTVLPPTMMASERALASNTIARDWGLETQAEWPWQAGIKGC